MKIPTDKQAVNCFIMCQIWSWNMKKNSQGTLTIENCLFSATFAVDDFLQQEK